MSCFAFSCLVLGLGRDVASEDLTCLVWHCLRIVPLHLVFPSVATLDAPIVDYIVVKTQIELQQFLHIVTSPDDETKRQHPKRPNKTRQDKCRLDNTRQDKKKRDTTRQENPRQGKTYHANGTQTK